jgi:hypothetical protein
MTHFRLGLIGTLYILLSAGWVLEAPAQSLDRTVLPIQQPKRPLYTELDVRNATPPPRFEVKAPKEAPNVLVVLVDDSGFCWHQHVWRAGHHTDL